MRVLLLSEPSYPRHPGGSGKSTHLLAAGLAAAGNEVHILCESREETERELLDGVHVHRVRLDPLGSRTRSEREIAFADQMLAYLGRDVLGAGFDVVHDSGGFLSYFYRVAFRLRQEHGSPLVLHFRYLLGRQTAASYAPGRFSIFAPDVLGLEAQIDELNQSFPVRFADAIICPSHDDAEYVNGAFKPVGGTPHVIPDPVQLWRTGLRDGPPVPELAAPGMELVLFGGRIDSELKGGDTVLAAMEELHLRRPNVRLVLLGKRDEDFHPFQQRFGDLVIPLGWVRDSDRLAEILGAVHLVVIPSLYESFGMMCAEALAAGTPVIASPSGGMKDMIRHGENGFLLTQGNSVRWGTELADLAERVLSDPAAAHSLGARARAYGEENLGVERIAARVEEIYRGVVSETRPPSANGLRAHSLDRGDRARYLRMLERLLGSEGVQAGEAILKGWPNGLKDRCPTCTRMKIADDTRRLLAAAKLVSQPWQVRWWSATDLSGTPDANICPLALLEKDYLMRRLYGEEYDF